MAAPLSGLHDVRGGHRHVRPPIAYSFGTRFEYSVSSRPATVPMNRGAQRSWGSHHMRYKKNAVASGVALAMAMTTLSAQAQQYVEDPQQLGDVQVTANRLPQSQADVLASTTIIDRDEIERSQAGSIAELLQNRAGIEFVQTGAPGGLTSVFLRGTNSNHTLVLIDGVRINSASSPGGGTSLEFLSPAAIERIEVVRGPRAAAYGSDAIGGVIQIFTRKGSPGTHGELNLRAGEDSTDKQDLYLSAGNGDTHLNASLFRRDGDGFNAQPGDTSGEQDGYSTEGGQLSLQHQFSDTVAAAFQALRQDFKNDYDGYAGAPDYVSEGYQQSFSGRLDLALDTNWNMAMTAGHFDERRDDRASGIRSLLTKTSRDELGLQHVFTHKTGTDSLGVDYRHDSIDYVNDYETVGEDSRDNIGIYGMIQRNFGRHDLSGSLRYDDDELFGDKTTGNIVYAYSLTPNQQLGASYGTAFKAPSLYQLSASDGFATSGNDDLGAETSKNTELFWSYAKAGFNARATLFENRIDDLIEYIGEYPDAHYINAGEARIRGVELTGGWRSDSWQIMASVTRQDPENRDTGERLLRRAELYGRIDADYFFNDWSLGTTLRSAGDRRDVIKDSYPNEYTDNPGYAVWDLRASWQVVPEVELSIKLDNVFDRDYTIADGYNTQDRYLEGGVKLSF